MAFAHWHSVKTLGKIADKVADNLSNTVGGRPLELVRRDVEMQERREALEARKTEVEIQLRKIELEIEQKKQAILIDTWAKDIQQPADEMSLD